MNSTLIQMTVIMACGAGWRLFSPAGLSAEQTRLVLTTVVYYLLLPALVLDVLWTSTIGWQSLQYTLMGMGAIAFALVCMGLLGKLLRFEGKRLGAVMLAAAFPNVTYLGLPVLEQVLGSWSRSVVIQMDLFAATPLLFTVGIMLARHFGEVDTTNKPRSIWLFFNAPPFWAAALAILLNQYQVTAPDWLSGVLQKLSVTVAPLMIFSLGLALHWQSIRWHNLPYVLPVVIIKMLVMPTVALGLAMSMSIDNEHKSAAVLDLAMPSMVLGIVLCDRYRLDSGLYAMTVILTTALSLISLPLWYHFLSHFQWDYSSFPVVAF